MRAYFIRRFLLIPPTLLGITLIVFFITRIVPGGPVERALSEMKKVSSEGRSTSARGGNSALSTDQIDQLRAYYGFDKPWYTAYATWVGKVLRGDLGESYRYNEPVWSLIRERMPISLFYALTTLVLTYGICVPLGLLKAIRHRTWIDNSSSVAIFAGYAVPGYVLGSLLIVFAASRLQWFPMGGFTGDNFEDLTLWGKTLDVLHHAALPLTCYMVAGFAFLTMLMKNQLMDQLASDYVRTAVAKGVSHRRAVFSHAFRNSLIPVATGFGGSVTALIGGSFLIERIFDIDGFGLLGYTSILDRDYPVVMGILLISSVLLLLGNILSDVLVALVDPRIRFH